MSYNHDNERDSLIMFITPQTLQKTCASSKCPLPIELRTIYLYLLPRDGAYELRRSDATYIYIYQAKTSTQAPTCNANDNIQYVIHDNITNRL